ncbi:MAG: tetratricopeptide repeat protein [Desulfobulbaceae bacterium]|nr:tetratricopeptide repeat protein [Desulfobulbaceae bacterium]
MALLPFVNCERNSFNDLITNRFADQLTSVGFSVLNPDKVKQAAAKAKINLLETPSNAQFASLGKSLGVRVIVVGSYSCLRNATGEGEEAIAIISARFQDAESGETLISASTHSDGITPATRALALVIRSNAMRDLFRKGIDSYNQKNYAEAITRFSTLIAMDPKRIEAYHNRGASYLKTGDYQKALADYDQALAVLEEKEGAAPGSFSPSSQEEQSERAGLLFGRGIVLVQSGKPQTAVADFTKALAAGYDPATIYANLGNARFKMKELNNSLVEYGKAIKADPTRADFFYQRGLVLEEVNTLDASKDFSKAISLDHRYPLALAARGRANLKLGNQADAIRDYTQAIGYEPGNWEYLAGRGAAFFQSGDYDRAINDYSDAIAANPTYYQAYLGRAVSCAAKGDETCAAKDFDKVLSSGTVVSGTAYLEAGIFQAKQGQYREAINIFSKAIETAGKDGVVYSNRGKALQMMGSYRDAVLDFSRSLDLRADNSQDYFNRGYSNMQNGGYRQAIDDFSKAASLDPDYAPIFSNRGYAYQKNGNYDQAISDYNRALELIKPDQSESSYRYRYPDAQLSQVAGVFQPFFIYYNRGLSYLASGKYRPALEDFNTAIERTPQSAEAFANRGKANQQVGEIEQAQADYKHAIELDDRLADAYFGRGSLSEQSGNLPAAITDYTKVIDIKPDFARAYYSRGLLRTQINIVEPGMTDIKAAARMNLQEAKDYLLTRGVDW